MTATTTQAPVRAGDAEQAGRQVEELLDRLEADGGPQARVVGDELVRALMRLYGAGLARILERVTAPGTSGPRDALLGDPQVAALLTLHDLHPEDLRTRVARALASVPGTPFELAGVNEAAATVTVQQSGSSGCGCASTVEAAREAAEAAVACFAPEIDLVEVRPARTEAPLLQIGARPAGVSGAPR